MNKKTWMWIIFGALFPPLFAFPLIYYFFYRPLKDGIIGGSHIRFYFWGSLITSLSLLAGLPIRNLSKTFLILNNPLNAQIYIFTSFGLAILSIILLFVSIRNEPDKKQFLPIHKFKPDQLFLFCLLLSLFPLLSIIFGKTINLDQISHPFGYAIAVVFKNKSYFVVAIGFLVISITSAILEESFFRGILFRDYFKLGIFGQRSLLLLTALYFAICHIPISFVSLLIFALFVNRVRLAYNNLLPTIILHALWNASVTIAVLLR
ncbi:MAG: CPBP family intramembrane metalloprotease [Bacteriovorax sp.]|nr:CPBP family intramembrane metalloprotease [Bacteriovorax sp.]